MSTTTFYTCDVSEMVEAGTTAMNAEGDVVQAPPIGWIEVVIRRTLENTDALEEAAASDAARTAVIEQAVQNGVPRQQAEDTAYAMMPAHDVAQFVVVEHVFHVSPKHAASVTDLFDFNADAENDDSDAGDIDVAQEE